ncbi:MAG TPA: hypothetical protein VK730_02680 [Solirubrobacteraceae bacterium]|jgi:hypothetical protein|nr:hypothetical protein [Solirubrobacteraceae bacterium]
MRYILKAVPFTIGAILALAVGVSAASAALPEYKATSFPIAFTFKNASGVEPTLASYVEVGKVRNIVCKASSGKGELASFSGTVYQKMLFTYTGCREQGVTPEKKCTSSGHSAGEVLTSTLEGTIGYAEGRSAKEVGLELKLASGKLSEFKCEGTAEKVTVDGCTIGEMGPLNTSGTTETLSFAEGASHKQKWTKLEGKSGKCELTVHAGFFELGEGKGWLLSNETETFSAAVELKA